MLVSRRGSKLRPKLSSRINRIAEQCAKQGTEYVIEGATADPELVRIREVPAASRERRRLRECLLPRRLISPHFIPLRLGVL
jgi:hypothetical protein